MDLSSGVELADTADWKPTLFFPEEFLVGDALEDTLSGDGVLRAEIDNLNDKVIELTQSKKDLSKDERKSVDSDIEIIERKMEKISGELKNIADNENK